jgi:hypothetical protein
LRPSRQALLMTINEEAQPLCSKMKISQLLF